MTNTNTNSSIEMVCKSGKISGESANSLHDISHHLSYIVHNSSHNSSHNLLHNPFHTHNLSHNPSHTHDLSHNASHNPSHNSSIYIDKQTLNEEIFDEEYDDIERIFTEIQEMCIIYGNNIFQNTTTLEFYLFINEQQ